MNKKEISWITAKTGQEVPLISGITLHSEFDPIKEAEQFVSTNKNKALDAKEILVLGLGAGFHIDALSRLLKGQTKIVVLEPNQALVEQTLEKRYPNGFPFSVYTNEKVHLLFENPEFAHFLCSTPAILIHPPSYSLEEDFYKRFLTYHAPKNLGAYRHLLSEDMRKITDSLGDEFVLGAEPFTNGGFDWGQTEFFLQAAQSLKNSALSKES